MENERDILERLSTLEDAVRTCWDLIYLIYCCLLLSPSSRDLLEKASYQCPRCDGNLKYDEENVTHICDDCGHVYSLVGDYWCYNCLSQAEMDYIEETGELVCPKCGAKRYSR
jgi:uncharacterized protein YbaR (Trm112 family)